VGVWGGGVSSWVGGLWGGVWVWRMRELGDGRGAVLEEKGKGTKFLISWKKRGGGLDKREG